MFECLPSDDQSKDAEAPVLYTLQMLVHILKGERSADVADVLVVKDMVEIRMVRGQISGDLAVARERDSSELEHTVRTSAHEARAFDAHTVAHAFARIDRWVEANVRYRASRGGFIATDHQSARQKDTRSLHSRCSTTTSGVDPKKP